MLIGSELAQAVKITKYVCSYGIDNIILSQQNKVKTWWTRTVQGC